MTQKPTPAKSFDPFEGTEKPVSSTSWLWATSAQALCTSGLLILDRFADGHSWERHVRYIVIIGIVATWTLALRAIRQRLLELMAYWQRASARLLHKASESGRHFISQPMPKEQAQYIQGSIWKLRVIAAGLTIPFFVMPIVWSLIAVFFSLQVGPVTPMVKEFWASVALITMVSAFIVAGYFHWAILPMPVPVRVSGARRQNTPRMRRRA